ncbi:MAG: SIR2 family protein [Saprospiraceae bacterium]|nr:SIR2 family protein [Saprospiraceae bacterium]
MAKERMTLTKIQDIPWAEVVQNIRDESCVLILGPHALLNKEGKSITSVINDYVIDVLELQDERDFLTSMSTGSFHELMTRLFKSGKPAIALNGINDLIKGFELHDVYTESLIRIPFKLVIYTAPDDLLEKAFLSHGVNINPQEYHFRDVRGNERFNGSFPMLYYLMGKSYRENRSVLKHEDLFDYIVDVVSGKPEIPNRVSEVMKQSMRLILLGFNYQSWHLNILFRLFDLHKRKDDYRRSYARPIVLPSSETLYFFRTNFNIDFIDISEEQEGEKEPDLEARKIKDQNGEKKEPDIIAFIRTLHEKCEGRVALRELKKAEEHNSQALENMQDEVKRLFQINTLEAIDAAIQYFENRDQDMLYRLLIMRKDYVQQSERVIATGQDNGQVKGIQFDFLKLVGSYAVKV